MSLFDHVKDEEFLAESKKVAAGIMRMRTALACLDKGDAEAALRAWRAPDSTYEGTDNSDLSDVMIAGLVLPHV